MEWQEITEINTEKERKVSYEDEPCVLEATVVVR